MPSSPSIQALNGWLPGQDSNLGHGIQSPVCYHYTTGHRLRLLAFRLLWAL